MDGAIVKRYCCAGSPGMDSAVTGLMLNDARRSVMVCITSSRIQESRVMDSCPAPLTVTFSNSFVWLGSSIRSRFVVRGISTSRA
jgi:hypothetical protein